MCEIPEGRYRLCECGQEEGKRHIHVKIIDDSRGGPFSNIADLIVYLYREMMIMAEAITDTELIMVARAACQLLPYKVAESGEDPGRAKKQEIDNIKNQLKRVNQGKLNLILQYIFSEEEPNILKNKNLVQELISVMQGSGGIDFEIPNAPPSYIPPNSY